MNEGTRMTKAIEGTEQTTEHILLILAEQLAFISVPMTYIRT